jgi:hypothetical protein
MGSGTAHERSVVMLNAMLRWIVLRFLPRRLFPVLMAYEGYRLLRRVRSTRPQGAGPERPVAAPPRRW